MPVQQIVIQRADLLKDVQKIAQAKSYPMSPETFEKLADEYMADEQRREDECGVYVEGVLYKAKTIYSMLCNDDVTLIHAVLEAINARIKDLSSPGREIYPLHIVLMVMFLARCRNLKTSSEIADFYNGYNLILQLLLPGMPSPSNFISEATIQNVRTLVSEKESKRIFKELFGVIHLVVSNLAALNNGKYKDGHDSLCKTIAGDGQEVNGALAKGSKSISKKDAIVVSVCDCAASTALDGNNTEESKQELDAFIDMAQTMDLSGMLVMCDDFKSTAVVTDCVTERGGYYLMPLKITDGDKELRSHIEAIFNEQHKRTVKIKDTFKDNGRTDKLTFEILPAEEYLDPNIDNPYKGVKTLVKYTDDSELSYTQTRYYIASIPFEAGKDSLTLRQVRLTILDEWFIDSFHDVLFTSKMEKDSLQESLSDAMSLEASMNRTALNIINAERDRMSIARGKKTPISFNETMRRMVDFPLDILFTTVFCKYMGKDPQYIQD